MWQSKVARSCFLSFFFCYADNFQRLDRHWKTLFSYSFIFWVLNNLNVFIQNSCAICIFITFKIKTAKKKVTAFLKRTKFSIPEYATVKNCRLCIIFIVFFFNLRNNNFHRSLRAEQIKKKKFIAMYCK